MMMDTTPKAGNEVALSPPAPSNEGVSGDAMPVELSDDPTPGTQDQPPEAGSLAPDGLPVVVGDRTITLGEIVAMTTTGGIDAQVLSLSAVTQAFDDAIGSGAMERSATNLADYLALTSRLVAWKARHALGMEEDIQNDEDDELLIPDSDEDGGRLMEYRRYREAAHALLEGGEPGLRSFLSAAVPEVVPRRQLAIPPQRLVDAFTTILSRLETRERALAHVEIVPIERCMEEIIRRLESAPSVKFTDLFEEAMSRLHAIALFLALLELIKALEVTVVQDRPFDPITVRRGRR